MRIKPGLLLLALSGTVLLFLVTFSSARADIAPPRQPVGGNVNPGSETKVQMVSETVDLYVNTLDQPNVGNTETPKYYAYALVNATFHMQNRGSQDEKLRVRFPLSTNSPDANGKYTEVYNFQVSVDQVAVAFDREIGPLTYGLSNFNIPWAVFDVQFPVGREVVVRVQYSSSTRWAYREDTTSYIFETGAGWYDVIGKAVITVHFPYEVNEQNIVSYSSGGQLGSQEISWQYANLEPSRKDNVEIYFVTPNHWKRILETRQALREKPQDAELWYRLGKDILEAVRENKGFPKRYPGTKTLLNESLDAHLRAIKLWPNDLEIHTSYHQLISTMISSFNIYLTQAQAAQMVQEIKNEIEAYSKLNPDKYELEELNSRLAEAQYFADTGSFPNRYASSTPTSTKIPEWTAAPTSTFRLTETNTPAASPTVPSSPTALLQATATPVPSSSPTPVPGTQCGLLAMGLAGVVVASWWWKKKRG